MENWTTIEDIIIVLCQVYWFLGPIVLTYKMRIWNTYQLKTRVSICKVLSLFSLLEPTKESMRGFF